MLFVSAPLLVLGGPHPGALGAEASHDLALLFAELHLASFDIGMVFFGFYCLLIGWLIYVSGFLPRLLGIALAIGGLLYLTFIWPPLAFALFPWNALPGFAAEAALVLWLLFRGVDAQQWRARARLSA
jgi:hypothetical protein